MTSGLRRSLVAALIIALTLAGLGRALASTASPAGLSVAILGTQVPICHSGSGKAPSDPSRPISHDCCDDCALLVPAVLPFPPVVTGPAPVAHFAEREGAVAWAPTVARPRGPRLSRGPPAA